VLHIIYVLIMASLHPLPKGRGFTLGQIN